MQNYLFLFPDVEPLWIETCMDTQCYTINILRKNIVHFVVECCE